jgi:hypothetical protein
VIVVITLPIPTLITPNIAPAIARVLIVEFFVFVTGFTGGLLSSLYVLNPEYGQFQVVSFWLSLLSKHHCAD